MWLVVNDMGVWHLEHEGAYDRGDTLVQITVDRQGNPIIKVVNPQ
jgi:hypothetical protein